MIKLSDDWVIFPPNKDTDFLIIKCSKCTAFKHYRICDCGKTLDRKTMEKFNFLYPDQPYVIGAEET